MLYVKNGKQLIDFAKFIAYTRVSTTKQGLGLDAQTAAIKNYIASNGGTIIAQYSEKESGKETINRIELQKAIAHAKSEGATLIVAKLDRLSRSIADIFTLKKDKQLSFEVCDIDASDTLMLGIFATLAQQERELISRRTREALAALKNKGVKLGNPNAAEQLRQVSQQGVEARKANAKSNKANRHAYDAIRLMNGTLNEKAAYLNENGYLTRNGKRFSATQVSRLIAMYN